MFCFWTMFIKSPLTECGGCAAHTESPLRGGEWVELNVGDFQMEMDGTAKLPAFQLSTGIQKPNIYNYKHM